MVKVNKGEWDRSRGIELDHEFNRSWLKACRRVLKPAGTIWVSGTLHVYLSVGMAMQQEGYRILNDIVWEKPAPPPNLGCRCFTHSTEILLWATKAKKGGKERYTFNYEAMKALNDDLQMRSDWLLPICSGGERLKENGSKAHATQKPEALLHRILLAASEPGEVVLDPFFGSGTTGAVAKRLGRAFIGIEREAKYVTLAEQRIARVQPLGPEDREITRSKRAEPRIPFGWVVERGLLPPGSVLTDPSGRYRAKVRADGSLVAADATGSIHKIGAHVQGASACNGWTFWHFDVEGRRIAIDVLRQKLRSELS